MVITNDFTIKNFKTVYSEVYDCIDKIDDSDHITIDTLLSPGTTDRLIKDFPSKSISIVFNYPDKYLTKISNKTQITNTTFLYAVSDKPPYEVEYERLRYHFTQALNFVMAVREKLDLIKPLELSTNINFDKTLRALQLYLGFLGSDPFHLFVKDIYLLTSRYKLLIEKEFNGAV